MRRQGSVQSGVWHVQGPYGVCKGPYGVCKKAQRPDGKSKVSRKQRRLGWRGRVGQVG